MSRLAVVHAISETQDKRDDGDPCSGHRRHDIQSCLAGATIAVVHIGGDTQVAPDDGSILGETTGRAKTTESSSPPTLDPATVLAMPTTLSPGQTLAPAATDPAPTTDAREQTFLPLRIYAEMYNDAQKARIACANRAERGEVDAEVYAPQIAAMATAEHQLGLAMGREYRRVCPSAIRAWQETSPGIGAHLLARLLGCIGDPVHSTRHHWEGTGADRVLVDDGPIERRVSDLWSYCGHGDATRRRKVGQTPEEGAAGGKPDAKMLVHLLAESCVKVNRGPYRLAYDARKARTTAERPDWTPGHRHNDALRIVGKRILRDLWIVAGGES